MARMVLSPHMQRIPYSTAFVPVSGLSETLQCATRALGFAVIAQDTDGVDSRAGIVLYALDGFFE